MDLGLKGKVAIVTGGSQGIGKAAAAALAGEGVKVAIAARGMDGLKQTADEIASATGSTVIPIRADMTSLEDIRAMVSAAIGQLGDMDILVNNAVNSVPGRITDLPDEAWLNHIQTKVMGYLRCSREVIPSMQCQGAGRIVNIAGLAARAVTTLGPSSGITNAAVSNMTKVLSDEVAKYGILVNAVHPGSTRTERTRQMQMEQARQTNTTAEAVQEKAASAVPIGRMIEPEDIADLIVFLASNRAGAITGQSIAVDGGAARCVYY